MLFNSYSFLFCFLPVTLAGFLVLGRVDVRAAAAWLACASFFFYGWWNPAYLGLLLLSIAFNFFVGRAIVHRRVGARGRRGLLAAAITMNLIALGYFKYSGFLVGNVNALVGTSVSVGEVILPLGISFFTFTQIAFLVDAAKGEAQEYSFVHYCLFVTFFPHLIAGPILHHGDMMPQFRRQSTYQFNSENVAVGVTIFAFGLFKKVVIADRISGYVGPVFSAASAGQGLDAAQAWGGALAYTLQLYFDFSGYSDMAVGLARLFNVRMPVNFHSPYKATSIIEFWRRWHMSLSRFLRDYLYVAMGGNRFGKIRRYENLLITMLLGGLWHGAGWAFVVWGVLHGIYLVVNHAWRGARDVFLAGVSVSRLERALGWCLTFTGVVVGWVFFRASDIASAWALLGAMFGFGTGHSAPPSAVHSVDLVQTVWIAVLLGVVLIMPNTQEIMGRFHPGLHELADAPRPAIRICWAPSFGWSGVVALAAAVSILGMTKVSEFLYFQF
jgi:D-alanyl-lipoteichoic acid acyltransferase DltB (MBOAT superfamily)